MPARQVYVSYDAAVASTVRTTSGWRDRNHFGEGLTEQRVDLGSASTDIFLTSNSAPRACWKTPRVLTQRTLRMPVIMDAARSQFA